MKIGLLNEYNIISENPLYFDTMLKQFIFLKYLPVFGRKLADLLQVFFHIYQTPLNGTFPSQMQVFFPYIANLAQFIALDMMT